MASIASDSIPEAGGDLVNGDDTGMGENEIKELLGDSYKTEIEKKF